MIRIAPKRIETYQRRPEGGGNAIRYPGWKTGLRIGSAKDGSLARAGFQLIPIGQELDQLVVIHAKQRHARMHLDHPAPEHDLHVGARNGPAQNPERRRLAKGAIT